MTDREAQYRTKKELMPVPASWAGCMNVQREQC